MTKIELNEEEWSQLKKPIRGNGGFQTFLTSLRQRAAVRRGKLELTDDDLEKIKRYAFYDQGGYEGRLKALFERSLGPDLKG